MKTLVLYIVGLTFAFVVASAAAQFAANAMNAYANQLAQVQ